MSASAATYAFSAFAIPPLVTATFALAAAARLISKHWSRTSAAMVAMTVGAAGWQCAFALMYLSVDARTATLWARLGSAFVCVLAPATYQFVVEILRIGDRRKSVTAVAWLSAALFALLAATSASIVTGVRAYPWGFYPAYRIAATVPLLIFFGGLLTAAIWELVHAYPRARGTERKRLGLFIVALVIGYCAAIDWFAGYGVRIYPAGYVALIGYTIVAAVAITRYGLQPCSPALAANEIISTMRDVLFVTDAEGRIEFANSAAGAMLGYAPDEIAGRQIEDFITAADVTHNSRRASPRDLEYIARTRSGEQIELTVSRSAVVREGDTTGSVLIGRDLRDRKRYERETRRALALLQSTVESTADGIFAIDADGELLTSNRRLADMWRIPRRLLQSSNAADLAEHMAAQLVDPSEFMASVQRRFAPDEVESTHLLELKDGRRVEQYCIGRSTDRSALRVWSFRDVTARRRAEEALRLSEARYRLLFEDNAAGVCVMTMDGEIIDCNATFGAMVGTSSHNLARQNIGGLFASRGQWEDIRTRLAELPVLKGAEAELRRPDGSTIYVLQNLAVLGQNASAIVHLTAVDISDRKRVEQQIEFHAYHDVLTQLPNRRLLTDRLEMSLVAARRAHRNVGLLFIDLDGFKDVNDTFGHAAGDALLRQVAARLRDVVRRSDTVARLGGDEFTIMLPDLAHEDHAIQVAQKVLNEVARPFAVADPPIEISASIGIAVYPRDGEDLDTLLRNADDAMYRAKQYGRSSYEQCTPENTLRTAARLTLQSRLAHAIREHEISLVFQPRLSVRTGEIVAADALPRWEREGHVTSAAELIATAEETGLILPLGRSMLAEACRQLARWNAAGLAPLCVSLRLSQRELHQPDFSGLVRQAIASSGVDASSLEINVAESILVNDPEPTIAVLHELRKTGVRIALDEFGSCCGSFALLDRIPIDSVRIDPQFFADVCRSSGDGALVSAIVDVVRARGLRVASGNVETREQFDRVRQCRCDEVQGVYFSAPLDADDFSRFVADSATAGGSWSSAFAPAKITIPRERSKPHRR